MKTLWRVNGVEGAFLSPLDRGLAYGDGVFETMLLTHGNIVWLETHLERLRQGCARLQIALPAFEQIEQDLQWAVSHAANRAVIKLTVTRGIAERGYAINANAPATLIVSVGAAPPSVSPSGVRLRICATPISQNQSLAGIKHLNRLDSVLARAEWSSDSFDEGLMLDSNGDVICATAANIFAAFGGKIVSPDVASAGVAGVCRAWVIAQMSDANPVEVAPLSLANLQQADEVFICNSVRGIMPVAAIGEQTFAIGSVSQALRTKAAQLGL